MLTTLKKDFNSVILVGIGASLMAFTLLFTAETIRAAQCENDTGVIIPRFSNCSISFSTFCLSKYGTGRGLKK